MESQNLKIRAKKISELKNFNQLETEIDNEHSYIIIGYNDSTHKENYKLSLSDLSNLLNDSGANLNDNVLKEKIQTLLNNGQISIPINMGLEGPQGPQGPQGNQGGTPDISDIQQRLNELQQLINQYHTGFNIQYNLSNVFIDGTQNNFIYLSTPLVIHFNTAPGYKMPNNINVTGCEYTYNQAEKELILSNPNTNVNITINGDVDSYTLTCNLTNIQIVGELQQQWNKDQIITINLLANEGFMLPVNDTWIHHENCEINYYNRNPENVISGTLSVICSGTGNMTITIEGISSITYYFAVRAKGYDDTNIITYNEQGNISSVTFDNIEDESTINKDKIRQSNTCPLPINSNEVYSTYIICDTLPEKFGECYGNSNVYVILPARYYDNENNKYIDDYGNKYDIITGNSDFSILTNTSIEKTISINSINYYIICISYEGLMTNYVRFKKINIL